MLKRLPFFKLWMLILFLIVPTLSAAAFSGPRYGAPIILPGADSAADPSVIEVDGIYYMYPTSNMVSVECWRSEDLQTWEYAGRVWEPTLDWHAVDVWAPDVFEYQDRFYLYYTANSMIGVAVSDSPLGPFEDVYDHPFIGGGYGDTDFHSIDAHVFLDDDGQLYIYCTCYTPFSSLRVAPMEDPVTLSPPWTILTRPKVLSWEMFINEGPWMIKHDGLYYLMYSGSGANMRWYSVGYAVSDSPLGPFEKYFDNPILHFDIDYHFYAPGHNSVVTGPDGEMWAFYHTKDYPETGWDRRIRKNKIAFREDGTLYFQLYLEDGDVSDEIDDSPHGPRDILDDDEDDEGFCG